MKVSCSTACIIGYKLWLFTLLFQNGMQPFVQFVDSMMEKFGQSSSMLVQR
jgi:hypothetical protein